jgi:hypothetical protein
MTTAADLARQDRLHTVYGVNETGMPVGPEYHATVSHDEYINLAELARRGGKITRLRMIGGEYVPGRGRCYDISYVHGQIDGQNVSISTNACPEWSWIPKSKIKGVMIEWAKAEGVFAKGLGLLDEGNWSILG